MTGPFNINGKGQHVFASAVPGISGEMAAILSSYRTHYIEGSVKQAPKWHAAAVKARDYVPASVGDMAAKLLIGLHYVEPEFAGDQLAISIPDPICDRVAWEVLLSCLASLFELAGHRPESADNWDQVLSEYLAADAADAEAISECSKLEDSRDQSAIDAANERLEETSERWSAARDKMMQTPAARLADVTIKVDVATASMRVDHYAAVKTDILRFANGEMHNG